MSNWKPTWISEIPLIGWICIFFVAFMFSGGVYSYLSHISLKYDSLDCTTACGKGNVIECGRIIKCKVEK